MTANVGYSRQPSRAAAVIIVGLAISVLVVDDDATFRRLARLVLAAHGLVVVAEADSVAEARSTAMRVKPDGALVDVELPDGDGFTLAGELTALPWRPRVVVTSVLAANGSPSQAQRMRSGGLRPEGRSREGAARHDGSAPDSHPGAAAVGSSR